MRIEHPDISGVAARLKPGLAGIWIPKLFQYFMIKSCLFRTVQSQIWGWHNDSINPG